MRLILIIAFLLTGTASVSAQVNSDNMTERFRLADQYQRAGQLDRAVTVLEDLLAEAPSSTPVFDRLRNAYLSANRFDDAIRLIEERMTLGGRTPALLAELGSAYFSAGQPDEARTVWNEALQVGTGSPQTYRVLYTVYFRNRLWEDARDVLLEGRERLRQPGLFGLELAELFGRTNQHVESLHEWVNLLEEDSSRISFVQSRMGRLLEQSEAGNVYRQELDRLIRRDPTRLSLRRLAGWMASETGDFAEGLNHIRAVDRLAQESGESLFSFAESALQAHALDEALQAYDIILENHQDSPTAPAALMSSALLFEKRAIDAGEHLQPGPFAEEARDRYVRFMTHYGHHAAAPTAILRLANLHRDVFRDFPEAETLLRNLLERQLTPNTRAEIQLELGELLIRQGRIAHARAAFRQVDADQRTGDRAERARLALAELDFFEGNFDASLSRAQAMHRNPATNVANNAIDMRLLISEHTGPDSLSSALRMFARSQLLQRQYLLEDALQTLDTLLQSYGGHSIIPIARYRRAEALRNLLRPEEAVAELSILIASFQESHLIDRSLFLRAEIHERDRDDYRAAFDGYTELLTRFPGSPLAPEARSRARIIQSRHAL